MSLPASKPLNAPAPRWAWVVATGFGSGWLKPAPGTWGTLASIPVWFLLAYPLGCLGRMGRNPWLFVAELGFLLLPILMTWIAVVASDRVAAEMRAKDPGFIVADEWAGMWIALWPLRGELAHPFTARAGWMLLAAFLAFRLFDIWKPWPARQIQVLDGGQGIVADDVVAGLYAALLVQAMLGLHF